MAYAFDTIRQRAKTEQAKRLEQSRRDPLENEAEALVAQTKYLDMAGDGDPQQVATAILARLGERPAKVHTGSAVTADLHSKGAEGATKGGEIYVDSNDPELIAHEAAHIVQQRHGESDQEQYRLMPVEKLMGPLDIAPAMLPERKKPEDAVVQKPAAKVPQKEAASEGAEKELEESEEEMEEMLQQTGPTPQDRAAAYQARRMQYSKKNFLRMGAYIEPGQEATEPGFLGIGAFVNTWRREGFGQAFKNQLLHDYEKSYDPIIKLEGLDPEDVVKTKEMRKAEKEEKKAAKQAEKERRKAQKLQARANQRESDQGIEMMDIRSDGNIYESGELDFSDDDWTSREEQQEETQELENQLIKRLPRKKRSGK